MLNLVLARCVLGYTSLDGGGKFLSYLPKLEVE
jgi:hypothetical protein